jgi:subtilase family serine protease
MRTDVGDAIPGVTTDLTPPGYGPADLHLAYNIPNTGGTGQTVGIVDAYDDPNAAQDLSVYRKNFKLPPCTTGNGCFQKLNQEGVTTNYPAPNEGWAGEISLDLDMVSAICPACKIVLVEANTNEFIDLGASVDTAVTKGADVVSNSYDGSEFSSHNKDYSHPGHVILAAAGDAGFGAGPQQPCSYQTIVCVGGTSLAKGGGARGWTETVWPGTGSGCSVLVAKPKWQHDKGCRNRTETDVSAVADPETGVAIYDSYEECCWLVFGGTSVATPVIASLYALAGNVASQHAADNIWDGKGDHLFDITSGSNGSCSGSYLCTDGTHEYKDYGGPTGWGTPNGLGAF